MLKPPLQVYEIAPVPDSVTELPAQNVVAPPAEIVDAVGVAFTVTLIVFEFIFPQLLLFVTK